MVLVSKKTASVFLLAIMVLSVLGIFTNQPDNSVKENGFAFLQTPTGWQVTVNNQQYTFAYLPSELDFPSIKLPQGEKVYLAYDPTAKNISVEYAIAQTGALLMARNMRPVPACIKEEQCPEELPIVTCETAQAPVLLFRSAETKAVLQEKQCTIIQAPASNELDKAVEKMTYELLGVMTNG